MTHHATLFFASCSFYTMYNNSMTACAVTCRYSSGIHALLCQQHLLIICRLHPHKVLFFRENTIGSGLYKPCFHFLTAIWTKHFHSSYFGRCETIEAWQSFCPVVYTFAFYSSISNGTTGFHGLNMTQPPSIASSIS